MDNKEQAQDAIIKARECIENCKFDDALELLERAQELDEENYEVFYELGRLYFELGDYPSSIACYENLIEKHQNAIFYYNLAQSYEANDEIDKAIGQYIITITLNDKFAPAYKKLATCFLARGDKNDAIDYFKSYLKLDIPEIEKTGITQVLERLENDKS